MKLTRVPLLQVILFLISLSFISISASAQNPCGCDFVISLKATETTFDGAAKGVKPGDKICFTSGTRTGIGFKNIHGTPENPVIITNMCDGKVILSAPSNWGNAVETLHCDNFRFTGSGNPNEEYGIEIIGAQQGINLHEFSTDFEVDHLYVHDVGSCGIVCKTDPTCDPASWRGAFLLKNLFLHHNKIFNTGTEGFYIGNSHYDGGVTKVCNSVSTHIDEHDVDNVEVAYNIITDTGNEGLQVGSTTNAVAHHNIITNAGNKNSDAAQANNFQAGSGTRMTAYNNIMNGSKGYGVVDTGGGGTYYNNIMMNNLSGGMQLQDISPNWAKDVVNGVDVYAGYKIFNNTFINNKGYGAWMYSENPGMTYYYNNIVVGQNEANYKYVAFNNQSKNKWTESNNLRTQDITTVKFLDAANLDFRLLVGSPAIDGGKDLTSFGVNFDFDEKTRPKGTGFDIGALEYQPNGPTAKAGVDQSIQLPTNSVILKGAGTSVTGITGYTWSKKSGPACTLANETTSEVTISNLLEGIYVFELQVTDASGFDFDLVTVTVLPVNTNQNPVAKAGDDQIIALPTNTTTFNGIGTDADGTIKTYEWIKVSGPSCTLGGATTKDLTVSGIVTAGDYVFQLTVKDDKNATASDQVTLTVNAAGVNQKPKVSVGSARTIYLPTNTVEIVATAVDPDGTIANVSWLKLSGGTVTLGVTNSLTFNPTDLALGTYVFRVWVTDDDGAQSYNDVTVNVLQANQPPVAAAGNDQELSLPTNNIDITGSGTDNDGTIATYLWTKVSGPVATLAGTGTATLSVTGMVQGNYVFGLTVTDNQGATGYDEVSVAVDVTEPVANEPPLAIAGGNVSFSLPTNQVNLYGSGFDADGTITTYAWTKASGAAATLTNANKPTLTVSGLTAGQYNFRLTVTDDKGFTDEDIAIVTVSDLGTNIFPISSAGADQIVRLPANSVVLNGSGTDQDGAIMAYEWTKASGPPATITAPDAATTSITGLVEGEYGFRLMVTDDKGATDLNDVIVRVVSATSNIPPIVNAGADASIFVPASTYTFADATASDDGTIGSYQWVKLSGPAATLNNPTELNLSVKDLELGDYTFQLSVTDNNSATVFDIVKISVLPGSFQPPVVNAGVDREIALPTNSISLTGTASAPTGSIVSTVWTKVLGPAATLTNDNTLTLVVTNMEVGTYVFKLTAKDSGDKEVSDNVQVIVDPVPPNKPPVVTAGVNTSIELPTSQIQITGTATDPDGTVVSVKWTQVSGPNDATLANDATLTVTASGLVEGSYVFKLTATDNAGATGVNQVIVAVVQPSTGSQAPIVSLGDDITITLPQDTVSVVGTAFDPDGSIGSFSWNQVSGDAGVQMTVTQGTILQLSDLVLGTYEFSLTVTDDELLTGADTVKIFVIEKNQEVPLFFSPNNDGIGDVWVFRNVDDYQTCKLVVFSRAGQVVFEANPYQNNWDGTHNGKFLAGGDYYYSLNCTDGSKNQKGALRIIR